MYFETNIFVWIGYVSFSLLTGRFEWVDEDEIPKKTMNTTKGDLDQNSQIQYLFEVHLEHPK